MHTATPKLGIAVFALAFLLSALAAQMHGQDGGRPLRILVDASKDGGLWWFPQAGKFDPEQHHQGMRVAARLRQQRWAVTELGRGDTITGATLSGYDVIVIIQPFFQYTDSEQQAYVQAVENGVRVLLLGPGRNSGLHTAFGFKFPASSQFGPADSWMEHSVNDRIEDVEVLWTPGFTTRRDAVSLATIGEGNRKLPIVTYLPSTNGGIGGVLYVGHSAVMTDAPAIADHLVASIDALGYGPITPHLPARSPRRPASQRGIPRLLLPAFGASLSQPADEPWQFDWEDVPGAVEYELVVSGHNASVPLIRVLTKSSEFRPNAEANGSRKPHDKKPYVADHNLRGWSWRVRARGADGQWGAWSTAAKFNVHPVTP